MHGLVDGSREKSSKPPLTLVCDDEKMLIVNSVALDPALHHLAG